MRVTFPGCRHWAIKAILPLPVSGGESKLLIFFKSELAHSPVRPLGFPEFNGIILSTKYLQGKDQGLDGQVLPSSEYTFRSRNRQSKRPENSSIQNLRISNTVFFFFFFGHGHFMHKFLGQGLNPHQSSDLNHSSDNTGPLTGWAMGWLGISDTIN